MLNNFKKKSNFATNITNLAGVSLIIPELDEKVNLQKLIPQLLQMLDIEEIIISSAKTSLDHCIQPNDKIRLLRSHYNNRAIQMNEGAFFARGDIFCFLHADVLPHPHTFTT
ncbi:MAG: glycosyltransferase, partial [Saprospiraceae bacterium]